MTRLTMPPITRPITRNTHLDSGTPSGSRITEYNDSESWFACITGRPLNKAQNANITANGFIFLPIPSVRTNIGPPWATPLSSFPLYITARVPSKNFVAIPSKALTHIQKMAPGPPTHSAIATPAMFPIPTVLLMVFIRA